MYIHEIGICFRLVKLKTAIIKVVFFSYIRIDIFTISYKLIGNNIKIYNFNNIVIYTAAVMHLDILYKSGKKIIIRLMLKYNKNKFIWI